MTVFRITRSSRGVYGFDPDDLDELREEQEHPPAPGATYDLDAAKEHWQHVWFITLDSMDDVFELSRQLRQPIIVQGWPGVTGHPTLEVYDRYRE